jgi:VWFA-related protein
VIRLALILACVGLAATAARSQPTFSARIDGVRVDVLVVDGSRKPLAGLTPDDFEIRDNGVLQKVDVVSFGEIPLSVALALDLSDSVAGVRLEQLQRASRALAGALETRDQSALLTFNKVVALRCPMSANVECVRSTLDSAVPSGQTALVDGAYAGIVVGESDIGRSLLMVFSDGIDTASYLPSALVLDAARRSDVVAYGIATGSAMPPFLEELTDLSGGRVFKTEKDSDLTPIFREILNEFRFRYLVTYAPTGVSQTGWHKLDVKVKRNGARVRARPGYQGR